jgi:hypothetical protein
MVAGGVWQCRRRMLLLAAAAGDRFGVWLGDACGRVWPVFGMLPSWRGLPTQLCGCLSNRHVDAPPVKLLRDGWQ